MTSRSNETPAEARAGTPGDAPAPRPSSGEPRRAPRGGQRRASHTGQRHGPRRGAAHQAPRQSAHPSSRHSPHPSPRQAPHQAPRQAPHQRRSGADGVRIGTDGVRAGAREDVTPSAARPAPGTSASAPVTPDDAGTPGTPGTPDATVTAPTAPEPTAPEPTPPAAPAALKPTAAEAPARETRAVPEVRGARGALNAARAACKAPARAARRRSGTAERAGVPGAQHRPRGRREPLRRLLPQALVVACLAGGTSAFVADDKAIHLSIDGKPRILHTFADDVAGLLDDEGIAVGAHDMVAPAPRTPLSNGDEVAVRHARPLRLTVDGARRQVWTTAHTVDGALRVLGVRPEGAYLSVSRSRRIARTGLTLHVRTERALSVTADGRTRTVRTNAATVGEAVGAAGIRLHGNDTLSVAPGTFPYDGEKITVTRVRIGRKIGSEPVPFPVQRVKDPTLPRGTEVVARKGRPGTRRITYATRTVDGVEQRPRRLAAEVVRPPRPQRVRVGTKAQAHASGGAGPGGPRQSHGAPAPETAGTDPRRLLGSVPGRVDRLDWAALARCESGGRPDAVDPSGTYGGLYQFDVPTWRGLGGRGRPQDAGRAEQTLRAKQLYAQRGSAPWPICGRHLTS